MLKKGDRVRLDYEPHGVVLRVVKNGKWADVRFYIKGAGGKSLRLPTAYLVNPLDLPFPTPSGAGEGPLLDDAYRAR